jgi:hypothetical protein
MPAGAILQMQVTNHDGSAAVTFNHWTLIQRLS